MTVTRRICWGNAFAAAVNGSASVLVDPGDHVPQMEAEKFDDALIRFLLQVAASSINAK